MESENENNGLSASLQLIIGNENNLKDLSAMKISINVNEF